ncbi:MAG: transketolase [Defluviitaleaceae bacterium]|nr:transketolase [Defluviitaleaceae bacterium]MCL2238356.1 transketolase [Defluviitaleaceae bacterium]
MQKAYITALYGLMLGDKRVCSLLSDSGTEYDALIFREFPNRCFNFGIAEENKVAAASGLAAFGKIPFVYTTGAFLAYRAYEFIRNDICIQKSNVKLTGMGTGMGWSTLGPSHHTTEDISALRALPNLTLFIPASPMELQACVKAAYEIEGPVYIRMCMHDNDEIYDAGYTFVPGKNIVLANGSEIVVFSTGSIVSEGLAATKLLEEKGVSVRFVNVHTLKPLDKENIIAVAKDVRHIFTLEEHTVLGGLGGAVAEVLAEAGLGVPVKRIGLNDCFAAGYGTQAEVKKMNGLDSAHIFNKIWEAIK